MTKKLAIDYGTENDLVLTRIHFNATMSIEPNESANGEDLANRDKVEFDCTITSAEIVVPYRVGKEVVRRETTTELPMSFINKKEVHDEFMDYINKNVFDIWNEN